MIHECSGHGQNGVITSETVIARKGDNFAYEPAFIEPLHSGTEFTCLTKRNNWVLIALINGEQGWVKNDSVMHVQHCGRFITDDDIP